MIPGRQKASPLAGKRSDNGSLNAGLINLIDWRRSLPLVAAALVLASACAHAPSATQANPWTRDIAFAPMGSAEKAEAAYLVGSGPGAGPYTIRVRIAAGGSIAPHTHPDARILTVVAGEVFYGFGATADLAAAKLYRTGDVFTVPANAPHYAFATTSEAIYQESGVGPTAFAPVR